MDNNEQESGLTAGEVFKVIFKKKWLLLALTAVVAVASTLIITYFINPKLTAYESAFEIAYPGLEESVYPDGTPFDYKSIVSLESMTAVKSGNPEFADVDVARMSAQNDIKLIRNTEGSGSGVSSPYTLTVKSDYFKDAGVAKNFVTALISYPAAYAKTCVETFDFSNNLVGYNAANSYRSRLDYLTDQKNLIVAGYESLIGTYGEMFVVDGKKIGDYLAEVSQYFNNNRLGTLFTELENNGYLLEVGYLDTVKSDIALLEREKEDNDKIIADLKTELADLVKIYGTNGSAVVTYESFNARITELAERNVKIDRELAILNTYLQNNGGETAVPEGLGEFDRKLTVFYDELRNLTGTYTKVVKTAYNSASRVTFEYSSVIVGTGGVGLTISVIGSIAGGFVLGCIVNLIVDMPKYLRSKKAAAAKEKAAEDAE